MMRALLLAALLLAGPALAQAPSRPAPPAAAGPEKPTGLRLEAVMQLRGPGGRWGTPVVDEANRRLYLPRGVAGLSVLALDGFKPLAEIADTAGSIAVALDPVGQGRTLELGEDHLVGLAHDVGRVAAID